MEDDVRYVVAFGAGIHIETLETIRKMNTAVARHANVGRYEAIPVDTPSA
jgi:hypothetical protein